MEMTTDQRKEKLGQELQRWLAQGWRIESHSDYFASIVKGKKPNHILHLILTLVTMGLWGFIWLVLVLTMGEQRKTIQIDAYGGVLTSGV